MNFVFDILSAALLAGSLGVCIFRCTRHEPPILPYLLIALVCVAANWLSDNTWAALFLLAAASFLLLACILSGGRKSQNQRR